MIEEEFTYGEFLEAKKITYVAETTEALRNITLNSGDIEDDILTEQFFERKDIGDEKLKLLKFKTDRFKSFLHENNI